MPVGEGELCWGLVRFIGRGWSVGVGGFVSILLSMSDFSSCGRVDDWEGSGGGVCWVKGSSGSFWLGLLSSWVARFV